MQTYKKYWCIHLAHQYGIGRDLSLTKDLKKLALFEKRQDAELFLKQLPIWSGLRVNIVNVKQELTTELKPPEVLTETCFAK